MNTLKFLITNARRDSRRNRSKLMMFMASIVVGIAAVVSINSFNDNLVKDIDSQTASLIGADIRINANKKAPDYLLSHFDSIPGDLALEMELLSMAYIPKNDASQIVNVKAIRGGFPFYGKINTDPVIDPAIFKDYDNALVDAGLMEEHKLVIGDSIKLGRKKFLIVAKLKTAFGGSGLSSSFAPAIYIGEKFLDETGLVTDGSLVDYTYFKKTMEGFDSDEWRKQNRDYYSNENFRISTIESQKRRLSRAFGYLSSFLNLVALISLLLGCIGVASSIYIYVKAKANAIAIYRTLGMSSGQAFMLYFLQIVFWGSLAILTGAILGTFVQLLLPKLMSEFLPFEVTTRISIPALLEAGILGIVITTLFALLPLLSIRKMSPLRILRVSNNESESLDPLKILISGLIVLSIFSFLWIITNDVKSAFFYSIGLVLSYLFLVVISNISIWLARKFFPRKWNFVLRQGVSNLYRPNNQTRTLIVSIGLGTAILASLFIVQSLLLSNVAKMDAGEQPNVVMYGINSAQVDSIAKFTLEQQLLIIQQVPVVSVKLEEWKGKTKKQWLQDTTANFERWAINRETRVSYRSELFETEKLIRGNLPPKIESTADTIYISLADSYAEALDLDLGDELVWNVQGMRIKTFVSAIRSIDYSNMNARFFILFPEGVLEKAPQFHVLISKSPNTQKTANFRSALVKRFPNVSVVDLSTILASLNEILRKISYIIQFMAGFSILTGLIVLLSSLLLSKYQRVKESVLLRTIGASGSQVFKIFATEYFLLGFLSAVTGLILAILSSYIIVKTQLQLSYDINWLQILMILIFVITMTVGIGLFNSREVLQKSPLEVLRNELS